MVRLETVRYIHVNGKEETVGMIRDNCTCNGERGANRDKCDVHRSGATRLVDAPTVDTRGHCIRVGSTVDVVIGPGIKTTRIGNMSREARRARGEG